MQSNNVGAAAMPAASGTANGFGTSAAGLAYNPSSNAAATLNFLQAQQAAVAAVQQQQQQQQQQQLVLNQAQINAVNFLQQQQQFLQQQQHQHQQNTTQQQQQPSPSPQSHQQQPQQSMSPKDTTFTKIFVGGLPYHTTDESLRAYFSKYGNIEEAVVITDRTTGKSRGYGFVTMETKEAAEAAVYDPNPIIDGRRSNVNLAYLGVKSRLVQPTTGFIPLTIARCPIPATAATTAYGFHPFYYQPMSGSNVPQTIQLAPPNLLLPNTSLISGAAAAGTATTAGGASTSNPTLIDLSSAYSAQMQAAAVANALGSSGSRASPFVDSSSAQSFLSLGGNPAVLNSILAGNVAAANHQSNVVANSNTLSAQQQQQQQQSNGTANGGTATSNAAAAGYFTLPQHLAATFQSQLQDRINI